MYLNFAIDGPNTDDVDLSLCLEDEEPESFLGAQP
jgi:hypothetical protein